MFPKDWYANSKVRVARSVARKASMCYQPANHRVTIHAATPLGEYGADNCVEQSGCPTKAAALGKQAHGITASGYEPS